MVREGRAVNIHMFCARKPGIFLSTMRALDSLGLDVQQAVISCFNGFALDVFRAEVCTSFPVSSLTSKYPYWFSLPFTLFAINFYLANSTFYSQLFFQYWFMKHVLVHMTKCNKECCIFMVYKIILIIFQFKIVVIAN